ncbi:MAG: glycoside hydrolase family 31 protein [Clostridia bacterium]
MIETGELKKDFNASLGFSDDRVRDLCFAARYFAILKDYDTAYEYLALAAENTSSDESIMSVALRLWATCEVLRGDDCRGRTNACNTQLVNTLTDMIENSYKSDALHWLYRDASDIYLSNLAVIYGALQSAVAVTGHDGARQWLIRLRGYVFKHFLRGGYLVSTQEGDIRFGDLTVCAVPFCMFCAEDRVLIEAMEEEQERFFPGNNESSFEQEHQGNKELTLLSAWYFAEKGDIKKGDLIRAKALYNTALSLQASSGKEAFGIILSAIVEHKINQKENQDGALKIIHAPLGTSDPYYSAQHERVPRLPCEGEPVTINAEVLPFYGDYSVWLEYSINGESINKVNMNRTTMDNKAEYYSTEIGSYQCGDDISYRINVIADEKHMHSESFSYRTARWFEGRDILGAKALEDNIIIYFKADEQSGIVPVLTIKAVDNAFILEFVFDKGSEKTKGICFGTFHLGGLDIKIEADGIQLNDSQLKKTVAETKDNIISFLYNGEDIIMARLNLSARPEEKFFGMGERYSAMEYRGLKLDNYVFNQYRDQGIKTYMPCPFYISSAGYGVYLDTKAYSVFDFCCSDPGKTSVEGYCSNGSYSVQLFIGSPKDILASYMRRTGLPELPPIWAFGPWMSSNNWDSQKEVLYQLEMTKKHLIPATVLVIEQWSDEATFYIFNDAKYQLKDGLERFCEKEFEFAQWGRWYDPRAMVDELHDEGIKVLLWQMPFEKYMGGIAHPQRDEDERSMVEKEYYVKNKDGTPYRIPYGWFAGSLVPDFTSIDARRWWLDKRRYLLEDIGVDGFKTDGGECILGDELIFSDGSTGRTMHNRYVLDYIGAYYDYVKEFKEEGITFSRAGYSGAQRMPIHWAGDERSTWEAFRASIRAGLSAGLSGIIFWGWDLGGFHGDTPTAELYIRSAQMAAFCPVMQYHAETKGEFNRDRTPWNIADRTGDMRALTIYRDYSILRMNILPYIYSEAVKCAQTYEPLMRAMFYDFPDDNECKDINMQYMFGRSMLVAPVVEEGKTLKRVYLPEGRWYGLFDNKLYDKAGYCNIETPIGKTPVFVKENSIIPLNLDSSLQLFGDVGNEVRSFRNLCFDIRLKDEITEGFDFGGAGKVEIGVKRLGNIITARVLSSQPVILRFWNETKPESIYLGQELLKECSGAASEGENSWYLSGNCVIVSARSNSFDLYIEYI